jgi:DNA polymerase-3 subunit beta
MPRHGSATIPAGDLRAALATASKVAERSTTIPILSCVLMEASGGEMRVTGTDMERRITTMLPAAGTLPAVPVPAARLAGLIAKAPAGQQVTIESDDRGVHVKAGPLSARIATLEADDYPSFDSRGGKAWDIDAGVLRQIMTRPAHAMSTEESRYYLNGIYLHARDAAGAKVLSGCSTDGHRLFLASAPDTAPAPPDGLGIIVPRMSVTVIADLLQKEAAGALASLRCSDTRIIVSGKGWQFASKLVDGSFPEYDRVIPRGGQHILHVRQPAQMADHIATISAISDEKARPIKFEEGSGQDVMMLAVDASAGEARLTLPEEVAIWEGSGPHPSFGCQARYLSDTCKTMAAGFRMHIGDSTAPARCEGDDGVAVLMPMRI